MLDESSASGTEEQNENDTETTEGGQKSTEIDIEQLLKDPKVEEALSRRVQAEADKRAATIEKRLRREMQTTRADAQRRVADMEYEGLVDAEDYEGLGRKAAERYASDKTLKDTAAKVSATIESMLLERPEFRALGEDKVEEIYDKVRREGGNVVDLAVQLTEELADHRSAGVVAKAQSEWQKEMEALRTELGLKKRDADPGVSEEAARSRGTQTSADDDAILEAYGDGKDVDVNEVKKIFKKRGIDFPT